MYGFIIIVLGLLLGGFISYQIDKNFVEKPEIRAKRSRDMAIEKAKERILIEELARERIRQEKIKEQGE
ncbi:MAG: hypothetical protein GY699_09450 [Desulfobacteraceae bacterium]|nr:hypothetical protein [Desulfobacteraceae bacterium]